MALPASRPRSTFGSVPRHPRWWVVWFGPDIRTRCEVRGRPRTETDVLEIQTGHVARHPQDFFQSPLLLFWEEPSKDRSNPSTEMLVASAAEVPHHGRMDGIVPCPSGTQPARTGAASGWTRGGDPASPSSSCRSRGPRGECLIGRHGWVVLIFAPLPVCASNPCTGTPGSPATRSRERAPAPRQPPETGRRGAPWAGRAAGAAGPLGQCRPKGSKSSMYPGLPTT